MKKHYTTSLVLLSLISASSVACDMHGSGLNFGIFGNMATMPKQNFHSEYDQTLSLAHIDEKTVEKGTDASVNFTYVAPIRFERINVEFAASDDLVFISDEKVSLMQLRGDFTLQFQAKSKGQHSIIVNISATENGKPHFMRQEILVNAS
ncbi:hypothetical protein [Agaribacter marinus]|uniref:Lipoprotein n=1 Tax=Agaribacter marinus TaxID=1431249 RepID=A0AA37T0N3_9ALTE|nr:hypothetical protein [Agaribacter marinus]GLR71580.1 hypothetical protein GCM10007852_24880 [Agaribacter marinus]